MTKTAIIEAIRSKTEKLISENRKLRGEYDKLSRQNVKLKAESVEMTAKIASLEKRIAILELAEGMSASTGDKKAAKARVNRLMREVDKCIALLNR